MQPALIGWICSVLVYTILTWSVLYALGVPEKRFVTRSSNLETAYVILHTLSIKQIKQRIPKLGPSKHNAEV